MIDAREQEDSLSRKAHPTSKEDLIDRIKMEDLLKLFFDFSII